MKKYTIIIRNRFLQYISYRANAVISVFTMAAEFAVLYFVWTTIIANNPSLEGQNIIFYLLITSFSAFLYVPYSIFRMGELVHTGKLNIILTRPINILFESLADFIGYRIFHLSLYSLAIIIALGTSLLRFEMLFILILIIVNFVMYFLLVSCVSTLSFWMIEIWPLKVVILQVYALLSGEMFPLEFLPYGIYDYVKYNPFSLTGNMTTKALLGQLSLDEIFICIFISFFYAVVFYFLYKMLMKAGMKKYEGGGN